MNITGKLDLDANKVVFVLMILAAVVSGCTDPENGEDEGSQSITVNEFSGFPSPVPAGQNVQFRMQLVNDGAEDVGTAYARFYNPPFGGGNQVFSNRDGNAPNNAYRTLNFSDLRSEGDQTPAVPQTQQQTFETPGLSEGRDISYDFNADILFEYRTEGNAEVEIMGDERFRDEGASQGSAGLENTRGPIQMEVRTPTPIRIFDSSGGDVTKQFCVIARNQGEGIPFDPDAVPSESGFNRNNIQGNESEVQIGIQDIGNINFTADDGDGGQSQTVEILQGKAVACFEMEITDASDTFQQTLPVRVVADYGYKKTTVTGVRVEGRGDAVDPTTN